MAENLPEEVKKAKENGDKILVLSGENGEKLYFKKPTAIYGDMVFDRLTTNTGSKSSLMREIVLGLVIFPTKLELKKQFDTQPFLHVAISNKIFEGTGMNKDFLVEEL